MLTRLEAHNFKNLVNFSIDFGPFTCIAGPNASGKSNIFDAIYFLSLLAEGTLMDAALGIRGGESTSDLKDIFWSDGEKIARDIILAAEMIVPDNVVDDFGRSATAKSTYLRYEVCLGYESALNKGDMPRIYLKQESLHQIKEKEAGARLCFNHSAKHFRSQVIQNSRKSRNGFISTEYSSEGHTEILVHQDGGARGHPQRAPAHSAPRTIVGTSNTSSTPTILAAKREMQKWRILALEPSAMRQSDRFHSPRIIDESGRHLAATLYKLSVSEGIDKEQVFSRLSNRISSLVPISNVLVDVDEVRQLLTLQAEERNGLRVSARSLSDGTLRFIALALISEDNDSEGLICMEEPENGIHPAKIPAMVELLQDLVLDPQEEIGPDNPMRQMVIATHSPNVVQMQNEDDLMFAQEVTLKGEGGETVVTVNCIPLENSHRAVKKGGRAIGKSSILSYLTSPPGAQISLEL